MFDTKSLWLDLVERSLVATCLSTSGQTDARYLAANGAYLKLVERVWRELDGKCMVAKGSAISSADRDRRLWLLDSKGFYDCEKALIGVGSGRKIAVEISAQRIWCGGVPCDLEFFRPAPAVARTGPRDWAMPSARPSALFLPELESNLAQLSALNRTILLLRMLTAVAEGAIMIGQVSSNRTALRYAQELSERLDSYICAGNSVGRMIQFDFSDLDDASAERWLLDIAGEIWSLIRFTKDQDLADMLRRLVEPYTLPAPSVVGG